MPFLPHKTHAASGFTLIELSIVVVIMGLVAAGVVVGNSLVKAGQLNATMAFIETTELAFNTFQDKYDALPGDMAEASTIWSGAPVGNGNGHYDIWDTTINGESYGAWYHLTAAGLMHGNYTGVVGGGASIGVNLPKLPMGNTVTAGFHYDDFWGTYPKQNAMIIGAADFTAKIAVKDAENMDKKMDDGRPFHGRFMVYGVGPACTSVALSTVPDAATRRAATYNSSTTELCVLNIALKNAWE